eukprot:m.1129060 g.1129060  ORF g.1129060 m.1129060 type:complete len:669 (+) comp24415_c0_seq8:3651-5657(+)
MQSYGPVAVLFIIMNLFTRQQWHSRSDNKFKIRLHEINLLFLLLFFFLLLLLFFFFFFLFFFLSVVIVIISVIIVIIVIIIKVNLVCISLFWRRIRFPAGFDKGTEFDLLLDNLGRLCLEGGHVVTRICHVSSRTLGSHHRGREVNACVVRRSDRTLDSQHLAIRVFIAMFEFEVFPCFPEAFFDPGIAHLRGMCVNRPRAVDFAEFAFKRCKLHAHGACVLIRQCLNRLAVQITRVRHTKRGRHAGNVQFPHGIALVPRHGLGRAFIHLHRMACQSVLLLKRRIQQIDPFGKLFGHPLQRLFKELAGAFDLGPTVALDKLDEIDIPDLKHDGPFEQRDATFVGRKRLFKVPVFLQEGAKVENDLGIGNAEFQNAVVDCTARLKRAQTLLQIGIQRPQLERLVYTILDGQTTVVEPSAHTKALRHSSRLLHQEQCPLVVLVSNLHFRVVRPHGDQIFDFLKGHLHCAVEDGTGVGNTATVLIHPSKRGPQRMWLAHRLLGVDRLHGFVVALDHFDGGRLEQRNALVPLVDVVRVLSQHDAAEQERTAFHQHLIARHPHLRIHLRFLVKFICRLQCHFQRAFFELRICIEHLTEIAYCHHRADSLLVHIPCLFKVALSDVVVCQCVPQRAQHVRESAQSSSNDGVYAQALDCTRVFTDEHTKPLPQFMV